MCVKSMLEFQALTNNDDFWIQFKEATRDASESCDRENLAAQSIQRLFRGAKVRSILTLKRVNIIKIQRIYRGRLDRVRATTAKRVMHERYQYALFQYFVLQIQKCFRGYYSRKYRSSHKKRKEFLEGIRTRAIEIREMIYNYAVEQAHIEEREYEERKVKEFDDYASNLHHLVSTKHIRGVFNPESQHYEAPTMNDEPVEDRVRGVVRDLLRSRGITKKGLVADIHGSRRIPLRSVENKLSLQASSHYDTLKNEQSKQHAIEKFLKGDKESFMAGTVTNIINNYTVSINQGDPYMEKWKNPLERRGVPRDQNQLEKSAELRKPLFVQPFTALERPFYTRADGNKSTCLPNNTFDVIADADTTGGAIQRQIGSTVRFGVPDIADNRYPGKVESDEIATACNTAGLRTATRTAELRGEINPRETMKPFQSTKGDPRGVVGSIPPRASTMRPTRPRVHSHKIRMSMSSSMPAYAPQNNRENMNDNPFEFKEPDSSDDE